jgi:septation ring formation regulator EzrA
VEAARDQLAGQVDVLKSKWQEAQDSGSASAQRIQELESQMRLIEGKYEEAVRAVQRSRSDDSPALAILERFSRRARFGRRGVNSRSNGVKKLQPGESPRSIAACFQSPLARSGGGVGRAVNFYQ